MTKMMQRLIKHVTHPLWMARDGNRAMLRHIRHYRRGEWCATVEALEASQRRNLGRILVHAGEQTAYYRDLFRRSGFAPSADGDREGFGELPLLTKEIVRDNREGMLARNVPREELLQTSTGGSTGTPMVFYRDRECIRRRKGQELFFDRWMDCDIGDKVALFVARVHCPPGMSGWKARLRNATSERLLAFDPYDTSREALERFYREYRAFRPKIIKCFPNSLVVFARFLRERGYHPGRPAAVSCTGENLYAHQKRLFEDVFHCPVFEKYGTFEHGVIASECREHRGMHLFTDGALVEILRDGRPAAPGELGDIVVTDLFNFGMPFIRYRIGDRGIFSSRSCPCGSPLPLLEELAGRDRDLLVAANGDLKPGYLFVEVFNKNNLPGTFQVIQNCRERVEVKVVPDEGFGEEHEQQIRRHFAGLLGEGVAVEIIRVAEIPREASGKYAYVKGECA